MRNTTTRRYLLTLVIPVACLIGSRAVSAPASGTDTYKAKCAMCHGPDGSGNTPAGQKFKVRDLRSPDVQKQSDADLTSIITNGKAPMPAYGKTLSAADIRELVAYIRTFAKS
jgi:mono/diheme cytochrome c family protein